MRGDPMFNYFKKSSVLDHLPQNFVDMHIHLLPHLDDGTKDFESAISLIRQLSNYNIKNFVCTPHVMEGVWENSSEMISFKLDELKKHLIKNEITDVNISAAGEYMVDNHFKTLVKTKNIRTFNGNHVLIELNYFNPPIDLYQILFDLQIAGYKPVLAHPERYGYFHLNYSEYEKLKKAGCLFQMNLLSISNFYGKVVQQSALKLLKDRLIDLVGTDVHHQIHIDYLKKIKSKKIIKLLVPVLQNNTLLTH